MGNPIKIMKNGIIDENPVLVQAIGLCPTLAVTSSAENGIGMGAATAAVLVCASVVVSLLKKFIPAAVRIPAFVVIIATFTTMVQAVLAAYMPALNASLGIFIPLIVVNCVLIGRAEAFASKNNPVDSFFDAVGMGLGYTIVLGLIGAIREFIGAGTVLGNLVMPESFPPTLIFIMPPGAFLTLGVMLAVLNYFKNKKKKTA